MRSGLTDKEISIVRVIGQIAGIFSLIIAITMIFSLIQLKTIKPLDSPALAALKEQYDKDPANYVLAAQVRAMDLMARRAYFSSRWQVEAGSYLLLAGAIIFILCQRLIAGNEKINPQIPGQKQTETLLSGRIRHYMLITASVLALAAIGASFILRKELPGMADNRSGSDNSSSGSSGKTSKPDKINYPFFRGQDSRGIAGGSGYPDEWDGQTGKNIVWKISLPKPGKSSPVIWEDRIFLTGSEGKQCEVYAVDKKDGKLLWTGTASSVQGEPAELPRMSREEGLAVPTAATNGKAVCAIFANGNLVCFDMDGKQKWAKNIGVPESTYGYSSSIIIFGNILIVQFDSSSKLSLLGLDIETGEQKWETLRQGRPVWSSPVIANFGGVAQVVINGNPSVCGFDAETGKQLWSVDCMSGDVAPSVAVNSSMAFAVTDYANLCAVKPGTAATLAWQNNIFTPDVSSPVATDKYLFLSTGNGDVACYNSEKGDTLWSHAFNDQFYASPIVADDKVYIQGRGGIMHIVAAENRFRLISEPALGETVDCTPAFSDKKIYIRGNNNLYCINKN
jgi:outer membrane protein assembly factor BamB